MGPSIYGRQCARGGEERIEQEHTDEKGVQELSYSISCSVLVRLSNPPGVTIL